MFGPLRKKPNRIYLYLKEILPKEMIRDDFNRGLNLQQLRLEAKDISLLPDMGLLMEVEAGSGRTNSSE